MIIRRMQTNDLEQVCTIEEQIFSSPWKENDFASSMMNPNNLYFVALEEERVIGYCGLWGVAGEGQITNVAVQQESRKCGVAHQLLEQMIEDGKKMGLLEFTLEVRSGNESALGLYQKLGFKKEGIRKNFYTKPTENAVIMWLR